MIEILNWIKKCYIILEIFTLFLNLFLILFTLIKIMTIHDAISLLS